MKISVKDLILIGLMAGLTSLGGQISIPIGPIALSLQSLFVLLSGSLLGPRLGALSQLVYILMGLLGFPVFAGLKSGPGHILSPSFGFILAFPLASYLSGYFTRRKKLLLGLGLASLSLYPLGLAYMYFILNVFLKKGLGPLKIIKLGLVPFIIPDLLKLVLSYYLSKNLLKIVKKADKI